MRLVSVWQINVLPQMRKTFNAVEQQELTDSIGEKGVLNAPIVALFNREELDRYLQAINRLWKRTLSYKDLQGCKRNGVRYWYVLLAGERRIRSYKPHVKRGSRPRMLQVVVHQGIHPFDAIDIQITENSHRRPPPHEEAYTYSEYWRLLEQKGEKVTVSSFAKRVGRSPEVIRAALRFASLPEIVRSAVAGRWTAQSPKTKILTEKKRRLPYGMAVALALLIEHAVFTEEQAVEHMLDVALRERRVNVEQFQKDARKMVAERGQSIFDLMSVEAEREARLLGRRRTVEAGITRVLRSEESYLSRVIAIAQTGKLNGVAAVFASGSVKKRFIVIAELFEQAVPLVYRRMPPETRRRLRAVQELRENVERQLTIQA
ncbi:MAG TPA: hypothetical protein VHB93_01365 [Candidatus Paceibacterota bacterium]|nr:hypothetical protein [Candidatus Paceibacterota bacterium]